MKVMNFLKKLISIYFNSLVLLFPKLAGKQSFYFFCIPFKAKLKPDQQKYLATANQTSLIVDGKKMQTYQWGNGGDKILFVHGWQSNAYRWRKYIEQIDLEKYSVIAFDAPGHGNSEGLYSNVPLFEKALTQVVEHYGVPNKIIGHSIGSFSTIYFLHKNRLEIEKFVSMAPPFTAVQFVEVFQSELKLSAKLIKYMKAHFQIYTTHPIEYFSLDNFASTVHAESLLIHDKMDKATSFGNTEKLNDLINNSTLEITEGYGHRLKNQKVVNRVCDYITA